MSRLSRPRTVALPRANSRAAMGALPGGHMAHVHQPLPGGPVRLVPTTDAPPAPAATAAITAVAQVVLSVPILRATMPTAPVDLATTVRGIPEENIVRDGRATATTRGGHIPARRTTRHVRSLL